MNRRTVIKTLGAIGALSAIPDALLCKIPHEPSYHFIGLGDRGTNHLSHFLANDVKGKFTSITSSEWKELKAAGVHFIPLQSKGKWPYQEHSADDVLTDELKAYFMGDEKYVLLAGIGGLTETRIMGELLEWLPGNQFLAICTLPFGFEGKSKQVVEVFYKKHAGRSNVKFFDMHALGKANGKMNLKVAFNKAHEYVYEIFRESQLKTFR